MLLFSGSSQNPVNFLLSTGEFCIQDVIVVSQRHDQRLYINYSVFFFGGINQNLSNKDIWSAFFFFFFTSAECIVFLYIKDKAVRKKTFLSITHGRESVAYIQHVNQTAVFLHRWALRSTFISPIHNRTKQSRAGSYLQNCKHSEQEFQ